MSMDQEECNFTCGNLVRISNPLQRFSPTISRIKRIPVYTLYYRLPFMIPLVHSAQSRRKGSSPSISKTRTELPVQDIQTGDMVDILPEHEIRMTLDSQRKYKGLRFMPEMARHCGKRVRVVKRVTKIKIESTGEMRTLKNPVYLLEGVYCEGEFHDGCERLCFLFWRAEWLKKV